MIRPDAAADGSPWLHQWRERAAPPLRCTVPAGWPAAARMRDQQAQGEDAQRLGPQSVLMQLGVEVMRCASTVPRSRAAGAASKLSTCSSSAFSLILSMGPPFMGSWMGQRGRSLQRASLWQISGLKRIVPAAGAAMPRGRAGPCAGRGPNRAERSAAMAGVLVAPRGSWAVPSSLAVV